MKNNMCSTVASTLDELELPYEKDGKVFRLLIESEQADFPVYIIADKKTELLSIIGFFPVRIPLEDRDRMYRFINELNFKTLVGAFVINPDDGALVFCQTNNVDGGIVNKELVKASLCQVDHRLRNNYGDIMKAIFGVEQFVFSFADSEDKLEGRA